ncbi:MAG: hypothetical protein R6U10_00715 [Thermoplasmatota archaeon]
MTARSIFAGKYMLKSPAAPISKYPMLRMSHFIIFHQVRNIWWYVVAGRSVFKARFYGGLLIHVQIPPGPLPY